LLPIKIHLEGRLLGDGCFVNSILGLPSPAGQNLIVMSGTNTSLADSLGGGALMQAAFDAAQQP
jgi:hypothetical protein